MKKAITRERFEEINKYYLDHLYDKRADICTALRIGDSTLSNVINASSFAQYRSLTTGQMTHREAQAINEKAKLLTARSIAEEAKKAKLKPKEPEQITIEEDKVNVSDSTKPRQLRILFDTGVYRTFDKNAVVFASDGIVAETIKGGQEYAVIVNFGRVLYAQDLDNKDGAK